MRTLILSLSLLATALGSAAQSKVLADQTVKSAILGVDRAYTIYLPASYDKQPQKSYPIFYLLTGKSHTDSAWQRKGRLQQITDSLVSLGQACEMIIVTPDAGRIHEGYFNMPAWNYEDFFFTEFMPYIESHYRVIADKQHRAIAGFSMGGGGSIAYALKHPELFTAAFSMSGLVSLHKNYRQCENEWTGAKMKPEEWAELMKFGQSVLANDCRVLVNMSDWDAVREFRKIHWFLDCGDEDFLLDANIAFYQEMRDARIPCELRVRDGNHVWPYWQQSLQIALPWITQFIK